MTVDILFVAKNRQEVTLESSAALECNTNWKLVRGLRTWDDTAAMFGSPAAVMNQVFREPGAPDIIAKIDNDVIVPPGWLDACWRVMVEHPELDLLGIEPPASRVPHYEGGRRSPTPEIDGTVRIVGTAKELQSLSVGAMPEVKITASSAYDLEARLVS